MKKILFLSMAVVLLSAPAMAAVLVVNDYEGDNSGSTGVVTRNWGFQSTFTNEPDVPTGGGTGAAKAVLTVADSGGFGMAFDDPLFSGNTLDLSAFAADGFLNFYIKIDAAITSIGNFGWRCCQGDGDPQPDQFNILDPPLPTPDTWTYISIKVSEKVWQGETQPDPNEPQKNHEFGWTFLGQQNRRGEELDVVRYAAKQAIAALGMDFGAVDVMYKLRTKQPFVLEVNSTPSLSDDNANTCEVYAKRILKTLKPDKDE